MRNSLNVNCKKTKKKHARVKQTKFKFALSTLPSVYFAYAIFLAFFLNIFTAHHNIKFADIFILFFVLSKKKNESVYEDEFSTLALSFSLRSTW
jgi:hypothetical protein